MAEVRRRPTQLAALSAVALCAALAAHGVPASAQRPVADLMERRLDGLLDARIGDPLPPHWQRRRVHGARDANSQVVSDASGRAIQFDASAAATWFGTELSEPLTPSLGRLRWMWRVDSAITGADLRTASLDDSPARFIVVFGRGHWFRPPRVIFYCWSNHEPLEAPWRSRVSDRFAIVVIRGAADPRSAFLAEDRDLAADFRRAFGGDAPPVTAIGFMIDTDQTSAHALSRLGPITWSSHANTP